MGFPLVWRGLVLAAIAGLRVGEIWVSWRRLTRDGAAQGARALQEPGFPVMVLVHAGWFAGCAVEGLFWPAAWWPGLAAWAATLWALSLALRAWVMVSLGRFWNVRLVRRAQQPVVTRGPYRWLRHPNYLAVILEITAVPLLLGAYWTAALASIANAAVLISRIRREEAYLFTSPEYAQAFSHKARLIPGLF